MQFVGVNPLREQYQEGVTSDGTPAFGAFETRPIWAKNGPQPMTPLNDAVLDRIVNSDLEIADLKLQPHMTFAWSALKECKLYNTDEDKLKAKINFLRFQLGYLPLELSRTWKPHEALLDQSAYRMSFEDQTIVMTRDARNAILPELVKLETEYALYYNEARFRKEFKEWMEGTRPDHEYAPCAWLRENDKKLKAGMGQSENKELLRQARSLVKVNPGFARTGILFWENIARSAKEQLVRRRLAAMTPLNDEEAWVYYWIVVRKMPMEFLASKLDAFSDNEKDGKNKPLTQEVAAPNSESESDGEDNDASDNDSMPGLTDNYSDDSDDDDDASVYSDLFRVNFPKETKLPFSSRFANVQKQQIDAFAAKWKEGFLKAPYYPKHIETAHAKIKAEPASNESVQLLKTFMEKFAGNVQEIQNMTTQQIESMRETTSNQLSEQGKFVAQLNTKIDDVATLAQNDKESLKQQVLELENEIFKIRLDNVRNTGTATEADITALTNKLIDVQKNIEVAEQAVELFSHWEAKRIDEKKKFEEILKTGMDMLEKEEAEKKAILDRFTAAEKQFNMFLTSFFEHGVRADKIADALVEFVLGKTQDMVAWNEDLKADLQKTHDKWVDTLTTIHAKHYLDLEAQLLTRFQINEKTMTTAFNTLTGDYIQKFGRITYELPESVREEARLFLSEQLAKIADDSMKAVLANLNVPKTPVTNNDVLKATDELPEYTEIEHATEDEKAALRDQVRLQRLAKLRKQADDFLEQQQKGREYNPGPASSKDEEIRANVSETEKDADTEMEAEPVAKKRTTSKKSQPRDAKGRFTKQRKK